MADVHYSYIAALVVLVVGFAMLVAPMDTVTGQGWFSSTFSGKPVLKQVTIDECAPESYQSQAACEKATKGQCAGSQDQTGEILWYYDHDGDGLVHCEESACRKESKRTSRTLEIWQSNGWACPERLPSERDVDCRRTYTSEKECRAANMGTCVAHDRRTEECTVWKGGKECAEILLGDGTPSGIWAADTDLDGKAGQNDLDC